MRKFKGICVASVTPFDSFGRIDYCNLKKYVRWLVNQKIDGFYVC